MEPWEILDKFTGHLRNALARSIAIATEVGSPDVKPVHILYSLSMQKGSVAHDILQKMNLTTDALQAYLIGTSKLPTIDSSPSPTATIPELSSNTKQALEKAMIVAHDYEHCHVGTEHLLAGLIKIQDKTLELLLDDSKITTKKIQSHIDAILQSISRFPDLEEVNEAVSDIANEDTPERSIVPTKRQKITTSKKQKRLLDSFAVELTNPEIQKNIDPVIGRDKEIERVVHILSRRTKNNPILLGDPGVGKTAIAEGLAKKITAQEVPDMLLGRHLYQLDIGLLVAGTIYRGEFEARMKQIIDEVIRDPGIILFIDEIHTIVGAGSSQGSMDAANILKPALARGQIRCIGATTSEEYKKHIESDPALERRFQSVYVEEPSKEKTYAILQGIKPYYEKFHNVRITNSAIRESVELSSRFIQNAKLPDKAIDLIDEASAAVRVRNAKDTTIRQLHSLHSQIQNIKQQKEDAVYEEQFDRALKLKNQEKKLIDLFNKLDQEKTTKIQKSSRVIAVDVAQIVSNIVNLPISHVLQRGQELYSDLTKKLEQQIIGQDAALLKIADRLCVAAAGLHGSQRPFASFLFVGPPGVGKTETAKQLARALYPTRSGMIRLDMSEFSEGYGVSKLLGAPAGYVGYRESTPLLDKLKHQPHSIVLFDNIDKAHVDVKRLLLQILEEGELTGATGKTISFKQAIVILTATAERRLFDTEGMGFTAKKIKHNKQNIPDSIHGWLQEILGNELIGRIDATIPFNPLSKNNLYKITELHVNALNKHLKKRQRKLLLTKDVLEYFINSLDKEHGARMIRSIISHKLISLVTEKLIKDPSKIITAKIKNGKIVVK